MSQFAPLFAMDLEKIIPIIIFAIVVLSSIVSQFLAKQRQQQGGRRPQRGPMDELQAGGQPGRPQARKPAALEDEIGDFLRRAAKGGGRQQPQAPPPQQARPPQASLPPRPVQARPKPSRPSRPRAPVPRRAQQPLAAEIVEPARPPVGQGLSAQVARDIDTADIARHAGALGKETSQATAKLEHQIHEKFDHQLGDLQHQPQATQPEAAQESALPITSAAGLSALLSDAESLKQAIILNEILQRPDHRW